MASFQFEACDRSGGRHSGQLDADSLTAAAGTLRSRGWVVIAVKPGSRSTEADSSDDVGTSFNPLDYLPPSKIDVELGLQQIASMLRSGMTLLASIKTAAEQSRRRSMRKIWLDVAERIQDGGTLADALARYPRRFPEFTIQLIKVGEASGTLDLVMTRGAEQMERARAMKVMLLSALMYPAIVLLLALGVSAYMLIVLIPKLQKFLANRHKQLPAITQALLDFSTFVQTYGGSIAIGIVVAIVMFIVIRRWPPGRLATDRFVLKLPIVGGILRTSATATFARVLGLLLESGITLVTALGVASGLLTNRAFSQHVADVRETAMGGGTLSAPLMRGRLFMPMLGRMVAVGEATGTMDAVLAETAAFHEKQLAALVRWLSVLIEPVIIVVVGGIVGFVYIAFFVALYSVAS